jgi:hypothetical protein
LGLGGAMDPPSLHLASPLTMRVVQRPLIYLFLIVFVSLFFFFFNNLKGAG